MGLRISTPFQGWKMFFLLEGMWSQDVSFVVKNREIKCGNLMFNDRAEGNTDTRESGRDWVKGVHFNKSVCMYTRISVSYILKTSWAKGYVHIKNLCQFIFVRCIPLPTLNFANL